MCTINQDHGAWLLRYKVQRTKFFVILGHLLSFDPPNNPKNQNLNRDIIILHLCTKNDDHMVYGFWYIKHNRQIFLSFWAIFCPFYPPNNPENQNFEKMKETPGDIIILHMSTINENHMMYDSWDMECDRQNVFSSWVIFCPFTPPNSPKNENIKKNEKTPGDIIILHKCTKDHIHMLYCSLDLTQYTSKFYFSFWANFCSFTPNSQKKSKLWLDDVQFLRLVRNVRTNRRMDRKSGI